MVFELAEGERIMHEGNLLLFRFTVDNLPTLPRRKAGVKLVVSFDSLGFLVIKAKLWVSPSHRCASRSNVLLQVNAYRLKSCSRYLQYVSVLPDLVIAHGFNRRWSKPDARSFKKSQASHHHLDLKRRKYALAWCDLEDLACAANECVIVLRRQRVTPHKV